MNESGMGPVGETLRSLPNRESEQSAEPATEQEVVPSPQPNQRPRRKRARSMAGRFQRGHARLKGKTWYGMFREDTPEGRPHRSVILGYKPEIPTKKVADAKLQELLVTLGINRPDYLDRVLKPATTFNDVAEQWKAKRLPELSPSTQHTVPMRLEKYIQPHFGAMAMDSIKTAQVNDWIRLLNAAGLKPKTVHNTYKDFRAIVNWYRQEQDQAKVTWYTKLPTLSSLPPRWLSPEEVDKIVNAATGQCKVLFRLAGYSGMRFCELSGLRYEDIDWERGTVLVRRSATYGMERDRAKTPAGTRLVYLDPITLQMIREHLNGRRTGLLFRTKFGTHLKASDVNRYVLKPLCTKLGIPKATMHAFRHGRVSDMVANGLPSKFVQSQIGQVDRRITDFYTHFSDKQSHQMVEMLGQRCQNSSLLSTVN